jgi:GNAT superfamily N-acetyltransferase
MLQKIIEQEVRAARAGDWTAILTLEHLCDRSQSPIPDNSRVYIATCDSRIVGVVACHQPSYGSMTLSHLYVLEQHRRHGVGTALMKAAIAYAGDNQIELVVSRKIQPPAGSSGHSILDWMT